MSTHLEACPTHCSAIRRSNLPKPGFTLIEMLVVVAIIALLVAILLPSLSRARANARTVICTTQVQQLMRSALLYKTDFKDRLPGTGINDSPFASDYNAGTRKDWLTWLGTWTVVISWPNVKSTPMWANTPRGGRLFPYYKDEKLLLCPSTENSNGKFSYSTPENVSMAMRGEGGRGGLPPIMDKVKHPGSAIQFLEEDEENGLTSYSVDDGFGANDLFADRHIGKATVAFFDGHANAYYFPRGPGGLGNPKVRYSQNKSTHPFEAWMISIAPFNSNYTAEPWKIKSRNQAPKFKAGNNYPGCSNSIGCQ